jgi:2-isopropylmalate synthase
MKKILTFDTTLRDGTQASGFSLGIQDKLTITKTLDDLSIDYIEGGWPGSNPRDLEFFNLMKTCSLKNSKLVAFNATYHKKFSSADKCPALQKTIESGVNVASIFGKSWNLHAKDLLGLSEVQNNKIIKNSVDFLVRNGLEVIFDAEHFFDGFLDNKIFALNTLESAISGGASNISLCDTNGGMLPNQISDIVKVVKKTFPNISLGIHAHNDTDLAVANSLSAIEEGVNLVQGTINGIGERCGNTNLCSILPILSLKLNYETIKKNNIRKLTKVSKLVAHRGNYIRAKNLPFVGDSAFTHKGGIHVSSVSKNPKSYESLDPFLVGNKRVIPISDLSGKSNLKHYIEKSIYNLEDFDDLFFAKVLKELKIAEKNGLQFEGSESSFDLFFARFTKNFVSPFSIESFFVHTSKNQLKNNVLVEATVIGKIKGECFHTAGKGEGPVEALDDALKKALVPFFPFLKNVLLTDFKVRITEMQQGTGAKTRVVMEHNNGSIAVNTVGISKNIIEASLDSLKDAYEWFILYSS